MTRVTNIGSIIPLLPTTVCRPPHDILEALERGESYNWK